MGGDSGCSDVVMGAALSIHKAEVVNALFHHVLYRHATQRTAQATANPTRRSCHWHCYSWDEIMQMQTTNRSSDQRSKTLTAPSSLSAFLEPTRALGALKAIQAIPSLIFQVFDRFWDHPSLIVHDYYKGLYRSAKNLPISAAHAGQRRDQHTFMRPTRYNLQSKS